MFTPPVTLTQKIGWLALFLPTLTIVTVWVFVDPFLTAIAPLWFYLAFWPEGTLVAVLWFRFPKRDGIQKILFCAASAIVFTQGVVLALHHHP